MSAFDGLEVGMSAEKNVVVTREMTIGHFVADMPRVYATPIMVLHTEMARPLLLRCRSLDGLFVIRRSSNDAQAISRIEPSRFRLRAIIL